MDTIYIGDYAIRPFAIVDTAGDPFDLTDYNVEYKVEREGEPDVTVLSYDSNTDATIVVIDADPTTGLIEVRLEDGGVMVSEDFIDGAVYLEQLRVYDADDRPVVAIRQSFKAARAF